MKFTRLLGMLISIIVVSSLLLVACSSPDTTPAQTPDTTPSDEVFKWRFVTVTTEPEVVYQVVDLGIAKLIEEGSEGKVQVETYPLGIICGPDEIAEAVRSGAVEMGEPIGGFVAGLAPATLASEMPCGVRTAEELWDLHANYGLTDIMREEYAEAGFHYIAPSYHGTIALQTNFPINVMDDLKGKMVWFAPSLLFLAQFGVIPAEMPAGGDVYMGMKLGTIDGIAFSPSGLEARNLKEVIKYVSLPQIFPCCLPVMVNAKAWDALGPDLQQKIQDHVTANMPELFGPVTEAENQAMAAAKEYGVEFITLSAEEQAKLRTASRSYWDEVAGMGARSAEAIEIYKKWLDDNGIAW
ncbi:MAG: TRAP transporter substrate-binding protein DctP [Dehalococcoidia bacterium]|nr:TRAP transporter substrate-binding protein DctP [Dehalococcoidia bacterium]